MEKGPRKQGGNEWKITLCVLSSGSGMFNKRLRTYVRPGHGAGTLCRKHPAIASDNIYAHRLQKESKHQTHEYYLNVGRH